VAQGATTLLCIWRRGTHVRARGKTRHRTLTTHTRREILLWRRGARESKVELSVKSTRKIHLMIRGVLENFGPRTCSLKRISNAWRDTRRCRAMYCSMLACVSQNTSPCSKCQSQICQPCRGSHSCSNSPAPSTPSSAPSSPPSPTDSITVVVQRCNSCQVSKRASFYVFWSFLLRF